MREKDAKLVAGHRLSFSIVRRRGVRTECEMRCSVCGNAVLIYVWDDDYVSAHEADGRAVKSGRKSFRYDCAAYLAKSIMDS